MPETADGGWILDDSEVEDDSRYRQGERSAEAQDRKKRSKKGSATDGKRVVIIALIVATVSSCSPSLMRNPHVEFVSPKNATTVEDAILRALAHRGWKAEKREPGVIIGTLNIRSHQAIIEIDYSGTRYLIRYVDSTNLEYRVESGTAVLLRGHQERAKINRHYNAWVGYLASDINTALGAGVSPKDFQVTMTN